MSNKLKIFETKFNQLTLKLYEAKSICFLLDYAYK